MSFVVRSRVIAVAACAVSLGAGAVASSAIGADSKGPDYQDSFGPDLSVAPGISFDEQSAATDSGLSTRLAQLAKGSFDDKSKGAQADALSLPAQGPGSVIRDGERLVVNARVSSTSDDILAGIKATGAEIISVNSKYGTVDLAVLPQDLRALADAPGVQYVGENLAPMTGRIGGAALRAADDSAGAGATGGVSKKKNRCGPQIVAEGDSQSGSAGARKVFGVDGNGEKVGIISDSFDAGQNSMTRAKQGVKSGDLPGKQNPCGYRSKVQVLAEGAATDIDEGRAMAEIVHDMAPGAQIAFATRGASEDNMAAAIRALKAAGATVIVDDITFFNEPMFQEGPISNAVSEVTAQGVPYYSSAANSNVSVGGFNVGSYETPAFRAGGQCLSGMGLTGQCEDFNPTATNDVLYGIQVAAGSSFSVILGWNEPRNGVATDYDIGAVDQLTNTIVAAGSTNNIQSQQPFEVMQLQNPYPVPAIFNIFVYRRSGTGTPRFKFIMGRAKLTDVEYPVGLGSDVVGPTIMGHNGGTNTISTAAISYDSSGAPEPFSSTGPTVNYFAPVNGSSPAPALPIPQVNLKPDITATDNVANTFFGGTDTGVPRFQGTSAAAPAAASIAALQLNANPFLTPAQVLAAEKQSAVPFAGYNALTVGAGLINGQGAVSVNPPLRPDTKITKGPGKTVHSSSTKYSFTSDLRGARFQCGVGNNPQFRSCSSPVRVVRIEPRSTTVFQVRAVNGKVKDKSPAKDSFKRP